MLSFAEKTFEKVYGGREARLRLVCRIGERKKVTFKEGKEKKMVLKTVWEDCLELLAAGRKDLVKGNLLKAVHLISHFALQEKWPEM